MTHGWPGSIAEFSDVIDELADPRDADAPAFHVVAPSLPGFGYSDKPAATGWGIGKIAAAWVQLMARLGYGTFAAHGGDWGGVITTVLGSRFPRQVLGIHTLTPQAPPGLTTDGLTAKATAASTHSTPHFGSTSRLRSRCIRATSRSVRGHGQRRGTVRSSGGGRPKPGDISRRWRFPTSSLRICKKDSLASPCTYSDVLCGS